MNEEQQDLQGGAVRAGEAQTDTGATTLVRQRPGAQREGLQAAPQAPRPGDGLTPTLTATAAACSQYHYHHHQAWRHLREAARHLSASRAGAVAEEGVVPDWILAFEPMLKRALEHRPVLDELSD